VVNPYIWPDDSHSPLNSIYSIFCALWGSLFIIFWKRRSRGLQIEWDNHNSVYHEDDVRREFRGSVKVNRITDKEEKMFSTKERITCYLKSFAMCMPHFGFIIFMNVVFLNMTGIINPTKHHALFQIEFLSSLCAPDRIFDQNSYTGMLPAIFQSIISVVLNEYFKPVAARATDLENHRTHTAHNNSLIIKRFAFNFCDYFLYLFYIGCYELRMDLLR
jgi:anoctamin-10/anoctamin-7